MAGGDEMLGMGGGSGAGIGAALLLIGAGTNVYDAFSAVMSSPWSTEKFTNDPEEEAMAREYVRHAMIISWGYALAGSFLAYRSAGAKVAVMPLVGAAGVTFYMYWLYNRALTRSQSGESMKADTPPSNGNGSSPSTPAHVNGSYPWTP
jgi:hypothetical protein